MAAERAKLRVCQIGVSAFDVAAVTKPHKLDLRIDAGSGADHSDAAQEVSLLPRQPMDGWGTSHGELVAKFDRFGNGSRRSDFIVAFQWSDVEALIAQYCEAGYPNAIETQTALKLVRDLIAAGWSPPQISN